MSDIIRIAIIEDNKTFTESLKTMLLISADMECVGSYSSTEDFSDAFQKQQLPAIDLILLDLHLPGKNGLTLVPLLRQYLPDTHILVLTQNDDYLTTLEAIRLGVHGYILKRATIAEIRCAIREINEGASVIDPQLSRLVLNALSSGSFEEKSPLSDRERQVLELLAMGYVKKEVADKLNLSYRTITTYAEHIYKKLQVPNIAAAVATAIRKGLI